MLSKQRSKSLFNDRYLGRAKKKAAVIENTSIFTAKVSITSVRINNKKFFRIELPKNNPINKRFIKLNLNTVPRPNYKNGSEEMYRNVNGLCQYCGHNKYVGTITFSKKGYMLTDIYCSNCGHKQPWDYIHYYTNRNQKNRGKEYSEKQKQKRHKQKQKKHNKYKYVRKF